RACKLDHYPELKATGVAPAQWKFDAADWWLEEHGLIMEKPSFPLPPGQYLVTGDRNVTTVLTIQPKDKNGNQRWELADGATVDYLQLAPSTRPNRSRFVWRELGELLALSG